MWTYVFHSQSALQVRWQRQVTRVTHVYDGNTYVCVIVCDDSIMMTMMMIIIMMMTMMTMMVC